MSRNKSSFIPCSVEDCGKIVVARGFCRTHYGRFIRYGTTEKHKRRVQPAEKRFWAKVDKDGPTVYEELGPCWIWTGAFILRGYGVLHAFGRNNKRWLAHRYSWLIHFKELADDIRVLHKCDNPPCVNPNHLFLGTDGDNNRDRAAKGRGNCGEGVVGSKLTEKQVRYILATYIPDSKKHSRTALARKFGVTYASIHQIVMRRAWKHVTL